MLTIRENDTICNGDGSHYISLVSLHLESNSKNIS